MDNSIEARVKQIVAEQLGCSINEVKPDTKFIDDLGADSLDRVELVMALEDEFDLVIEDSVGETFVTPQVVCDYLHANIKQPASV